MASDRRQTRIVTLVEHLCATEQREMIDAAETMLRALLNGAVALRQIRMHPKFAAEAVQFALLHKKSINPKGPKGNV